MIVRNINCFMKDYECFKNRKLSLLKSRGRSYTLDNKVVFPMYFRTFDAYIDLTVALLISLSEVVVFLLTLVALSILSAINRFISPITWTVAS